ncbi:HIT-like domain-containing protein [Lasiosphaeris hirsuta]|uniref:Aprataxin-like protein n=1 Tax=Lasiosphaeris hirsuta TaxID=260670 RepID=A0AA40AEW4_9PEZI|nr:HIT-like domain-containing protein [Lasiosphaeris hirsuta]
MAEAAEDMDDFVQKPESAEKKRNAFTELMAPKPKAAKADTADSSIHGKKLSQALKRLGNWRGALLEYIQHPEHFSSVVRVTPNTVLIRDMYAKATIHLLLLPRSPAHYDLHPHKAFEDAAFLAMMKEEAASAARLATAELARQLSPFSATSKTRNDAMDAGVPFADLPPGRDYLPDIQVGIHAHPSMSHLHVHIISRDSHSDMLKHRKHYNSFHTPFFIPLADYPLPEDDVRRQSSFQNANLDAEFVCWRCGEAFGRKFSELKKHLEVEFQLWKAE